MTYNEFEQLAMNPPEDRRPSVFVLHVFRIAIGTEPEYPEFSVDEKQLFCSSFDMALNRMQAILGSERLYCFQIRQIPIGVEINRYGYSRLWLYSKDGVLLDRSFVSSIFGDGGYDLLAPFRGRPTEAIRFNPGDIIEYLSSDGKVHIGIVLYQPCTTKTLWERMMKHHTEADITPETYFMDFSDDIYIVIDEDYKCWGYDYNVQSYDILPLSMPLPEDMRNRLIAKYEWAKQGN